VATVHCRVKAGAQHRQTVRFQRDALRNFVIYATRLRLRQRITVIKSIQVYRLPDVVTKRR